MSAAPGVAALDAASEAEARALLTACCAATRWVDGMLAERPFRDRDGLLRAGNAAWRTLGEADFREAFAHHPRIGESRAAVAQDARAQAWSAREQAGVGGNGSAAADGGGGKGAEAIADVRDRLAEVNRAYEARFGHIYIVCASGRSADELLAMAEVRLGNDPATEMAIAGEELRRITALRLARLADEPPGRST